MCGRVGVVDIGRGSGENGSGFLLNKTLYVFTCLLVEVYKLVEINQKKRSPFE